MKTELYRPGQAVITTSDESRVVAIINCPIDGDITRQVELAIKGIRVCVLPALQITGEDT